jgi:hypothetical protein
MATRRDAESNVLPLTRQSQESRNFLFERLKNVAGSPYIFDGAAERVPAAWGLN